MAFTLMPESMSGGKVYAEEKAYQNSSADHQGTEDVGGFANNYGVTVYTDKTEYALGEDIYIKIEGSSSMTGSDAWIGLFNNTEGKDSHYWAYFSGDFSDKAINNTSSEDKLDGLTFQRTVTPGSYYVIAIDSDGRWAIVPLTITEPPQATLEVDNTKYSVSCLSLKSIFT